LGCEGNETRIVDSADVAGSRKQEIVWVSEARPLGKYGLWLKFFDATEGEVDLEKLVAEDSRSVAAALCSPADFAAMKVDTGTVVCESGLDVAT
jgi:hypothetical protein